jgi:hypothetical protein
MHLTLHLLPVFALLPALNAIPQEPSPAPASSVRATASRATSSAGVTRSVAASPAAQTGPYGNVPFAVPYDDPPEGTRIHRECARRPAASGARLCWPKWRNYGRGDS